MSTQITLNTQARHSRVGRSQINPNWCCLRHSCCPPSHAWQNRTLPVSSVTKSLSLRGLGQALAALKHDFTLLRRASRKACKPTNAQVRSCSRRPFPPPSDVQIKKHQRHNPGTRTHPATDKCDRKWTHVRCWLANLSSVTNASTHHVVGPACALWYALARPMLMLMAAPSSRVLTSPCGSQALQGLVMLMLMHTSCIY